MPINPPMTIPVDPHLLAQWRFDERRRSDEGRDSSSQGATMVLGRWPDRIEFRSRTEVPGVAESARAIAATTEGPAYRAQLSDLANRIQQLAGDSTASAPAAVAEPPAAVAAHDEATHDDGGGDDWLQRLDATIAAAPAAAPADHTRVETGPREVASPAELPDFLAPWESAPATSDAAATEPEAAGEPAEDTHDDDDAFYLPPSAAPLADLTAEAAPAPRNALPTVPVLDFVVEPDEPAEAPAPESHASHTEEAPAEDDAGADVEEWESHPAAAQSEETAPVDEAPVEAEAVMAPPAGPATPPPLPSYAAAAPASPPPLPSYAAAAPSAPESTIAPAAAPAASGDGDGAGVRARLASLGAEMGMDVWGSATSSAAAGNDGVRAQLAAFDVVWAQDGSVVAAFLIAPASPVEGMLAISDVAAVAEAPIPLFIVAPESARAALRATADRPTFARMSPPAGDACRFIGVEALNRSLDGVAAFLRYLRPEFIEALAERL